MSDKTRALESSNSCEWYTPLKYINAVYEVLGYIDLDPASCQLANKIVQASSIYTLDDNGLVKDWHGKVFLNPPYGKDGGISNQEKWSKRLIYQFEQGVTIEAILLVNSSTSTRWFQRLWSYPVCFTNHKIRFYSDSTGAIDAPTHGNAFVYFGSNDKKFIEVFSRFGTIVQAKVFKPASLWAEAS